MPIEKEILTIGLQRGDEIAYKNLYDLHYENLVQYCHTLTHDLHQAEDIVQNVLLKIWVKRDKIEITSSLKSYLYRATFNEFVKEKGKLKQKEKMLLELKQEILDHMVDLDADILKEKVKLLEAAIDQLPEKRKRVFLLNKKEGYKYKEIAEELNLSEKTVEKHISRALKQLRETIYHNSPKFFVLLFKNLFKKENCLAKP
ncbi:RNA polymerase sigma factor [Flagellimonas onchidii]|uniref:RNA polymerase sigma factor n=1 Tax=Flagellimonas onchidii TaxID=2562684 RepID=UPI001455E56E|nr:RNA polymerase sigma-70 factor [Allomuricauda onchidii]